VVGKALRAILAADANVTALVGTRIYPNRARQGSPQPYVTYNTVTGESIMSTASHSGLGNQTFQVDVWDDDYADAHDAAEKIRLALQDYTGTISGVAIQDCFADGGPRDDLGVFADGRETSLARVSRDYKIWFAEAAS